MWGTMRNFLKSRLMSARLWIWDNKRGLDFTIMRVLKDCCSHLMWTTMSQRSSFKKGNKISCQPTMAFESCRACMCSGLSPITYIHRKILMSNLNSFHGIFYNAHMLLILNTWCLVLSSIWIKSATNLPLRLVWLTSATWVVIVQIKQIN